MTTATGEVELDFSGIGDTDPYTNGDYTATSAAWQVLSGGAKQTDFGPVSFFRYTGGTAGTVIRAKVELDYASGSGNDWIGPAVIDSSRNGYAVNAGFGEIKIMRMAAGVATELSKATAQTWSAGAVIDLELDTSTGDLEVFLNGVSKKATNDTTYSSGLDAAIYNNWNNTNSHTAVSFAADGYAASGPTVSAPVSITDGTDATTTGTLLDTIAPLTGDLALIATPGTLFRRTLDYGTRAATTVSDTEFETGDQELRLGAAGPVSGIPMAADVTAAGITAYVVQIEVDDQTNPPGTFTTTSNAATGIQVVQTMAAVAETGSGLGLFGSNILTAEDNQQCAIPNVVDGVTLDLDVSGDGTITWLDSEMTAAGGSITFPANYVTKSTGNIAKVSLTITDGSIVVTGTLNTLSIGIGIGI